VDRLSVRVSLFLLVTCRRVPLVAQSDELYRAGQSRDFGERDKKGPSLPRPEIIRDTRGGRYAGRRAPKKLAARKKPIAVVAVTLGEIEIDF